MTWSSEKPTKPGWYFYRKDNHINIVTLATVNTFLGVLMVVGINPFTSIAQYNHMALEYFPGEWAGPLEAPHG